jgi:hypothetical protein
VTVVGDPVRVSVCHCLACQRRTGSVFGTQARFPRTDATIEGPSSVWVRVADSGHRIAFHFCPNCGATVYYLPEAESDLIAIPLGAFGDPGFPQPRVSVYEVSRHPWVELPDSIERYD